MPNADKPLRGTHAIVNPSRAEASDQAAFTALADWFAHEPGQALLQREAALIRERVRRFHGDSMLWLGPVGPAVAATARCMVRSRLYGAPAAPVAPLSDVASCVVAPAALPIASNSMDGVVVHHGLEYARDPRAAIREVARVIRPGGRLLVCCFNPLSLWRFGPLRGRVCPVTPFRLSDWLAVLGFRESQTRYLNYRATLNLKLTHPRWQRVSGWLSRKQAPVGGVYMTFAIKEAFGAVAQGEGVAARATPVPALSVPGAAKLVAFSPRPAQRGR